MLFSVNVQQRHLADSPKNLSFTCSVLLLLGAIAASVPPPLRGQSGSPTIELISVGTDGNNSTLRGPSGSGLAGGSGTFPARNHVSANGRYVVFESDSGSLVCSDTNVARDIFLRDRQTGTTILVSVSSSGVQGNGGSFEPAISADGRFVAFESDATNLVPGVTNGFRNTFLRDLQTGTTSLVNVSSAGVQANSVSHGPAISADGRYVSFYSNASNLVAGDTNNDWDVFVRDTVLSTTERVSIATDGTQALGSSTADISADGRFVVFESSAFSTAPFRSSPGILLRDRQLGTTTFVSVKPDGTPSGFNSFSPTITPDGRFVAFETNADDLIAGSPAASANRHIFVRDRQAGTTIRASMDSNGVLGNQSSFNASVSADGRYVAFDSFASNLVPNDTNGTWDVFLRDTQLNTTTRISVGPTGVEGNAASDHPFISADGRFIYFQSHASNLVNPPTTQGVQDVFVYGPSGVFVPPTPGIRFGASAFSVPDNAGPAVIPVTRAGNICATATVNFATSDGTAIAGTDYTAISGTLSFASGDTSKTFNVSVIPTHVFAPDKTVNLTLSNATGTVLATPSTAVLTIRNTTPPPPPCSFAINSPGMNVGAGGGPGSVSVTTGTGCSWTAVSNVSWISITAGASGAGNGTVSFSVAANSAPARSSTLTIAGQTFTVRQASGCTFSINPTTQSFTGAGGTGTVTVATIGGCLWSAASNNPDWLVIQFKSADGGPGTLDYSVAANTGPARSGTMTIAGLTFTVTQQAAFNTPVGSNVLAPADGVTGISALFANVLAAGRTVAIPGDPCHPVGQPGDPCRIPGPGFRVFNGFVFDISTTATVAGPITLSFDLARLTPLPPPITPQVFSTLRVLHGENGLFINRTILPATPGDPCRTGPAQPGDPCRILAGVSSLSPFVIAQMNDKIVFSSTRDGNFEIYSMNSDGTGVTRLTNNPAVDAFPAWSPDNTKIAFTSNRDGFFNFEIYVMNADGSSPTRLTTNGKVDGIPAWSPDGKKIAFTSSRDGNFEIYAVNADGTGLVRLTNNPAIDAKPSWSPDGTKIAFTSTRDGHFQIYSMNADGTGVTRLTNHLSADLSPAWSPHGTKIAFASNRDGNFEVYVMNADATSPVRLTNNPAVDGELAWSPDGAKIVFSSNRDGLSNFEIYVMNADGSGQIRLTTNPAADTSPNW